jgi:hypothetical protein
MMLPNDAAGSIGPAYRDVAALRIVIKRQQLFRHLALRSRKIIIPSAECITDDGRAL